MRNEEKRRWQVPNKVSKNGQTTDWKLIFLPNFRCAESSSFFYCSAAIASFVIVCPDGFIVITKKGSNASDWEVIIPGKMHRATRP